MVSGQPLGIGLPIPPGIRITLWKWHSRMPSAAPSRRHTDAATCSRSGAAHGGLGRVLPQAMGQGDRGAAAGYIVRTLRGIVLITTEDRARLNKAADLLNSVHDREGFIDTIALFICGARLNSEMSSEMADDQRIVAAKAVRSAHTAVAKLTIQQKMWLGVSITQPFVVPRTEANYAQKKTGGRLYWSIASSGKGGVAPRGWTLPWTSIRKII